MKNGSAQIGRVLILILIMFSCSRKGEHNSEKKLFVEYNSDSTSILSIGYEDKNGKQGEWSFFEEDGGLKKIINFKNGKMNGEVVEFRCCVKFMEYTAVNDEIIGKITYYNSNGDIVNITYVDSLENGFDLNLVDGVLYEVNVFDKESTSKLILNRRLLEEVSEPYYYGCCSN